MLKHWELEHPEQIEAPQFRFNVLQTHKDQFSRPVHEAMRIKNEATMNSHAEWGAIR